MSARMLLITSFIDRIGNSLANHSSHPRQSSDSTSGVLSYEWTTLAHRLIAYEHHFPAVDHFHILEPNEGSLTLALAIISDNPTINKTCPMHPKIKAAGKALSGSLSLLPHLMFAFRIQSRSVICYKAA
jgi:hypothetical protein